MDILKAARIWKYRRARISRLSGLDYSAGDQITRHIFICGLHRSGTTLLEQYLYSRFHLSVLRANVPANEGQHLQSVYSPAYHFGGPGRFAFSPEMAAEPATLSDHKKCRSRIMADWKKYVVGDSPTLLEKSPPNLTKIPWLRQVFGDPLFIILTRDPRAVSAATRKWSKTSIEELMMHWNVAYSVAVKDSASDCFFIRYEDICQDLKHAVEKSGIEKFLTPRAAPLDTAQRFAEIRNTNAGYLDQHTCKYYGKGVWNKFGYDV